MGVEYVHAGGQLAIGSALLRVATHHLQPHTDAQHGLAQLLDNGYESALAQVVHGLGTISHPGQQHVVGTAYGGCIGRYLECGAQTRQGILHRTQIAHFVIDDCYHNVPLLLGSS